MNGIGKERTGVMRVDEEQDDEEDGTLHHKESRLPRVSRLLHRALSKRFVGTALYVIGLDYDLEDIKDVAMEDISGFKVLIIDLFLSDDALQFSSPRFLHLELCSQGNLHHLLNFLGLSLRLLPREGRKLRFCEALGLITRDPVADWCHTVSGSNQDFEFETSHGGGNERCHKQWAR
ncbi:hypothetical protein LOK49_LG08G01369 [Camellia lanceoleosa]|uniref:Uncharacterized protein n=1 Tax=Camellia lanceoleosa TaxID=1840588 RepID=A0ACC0GN16_9ERIC|nr:hypothetical protein LOK49_LG08G01369 [Camellia lanceoleosa]